jgi:hypothetical protein
MFNFGGNGTAPGQTAPKFFFLQNYWRVYINNGNIVSIALNLYTEDYVTPYIVEVGSGVSDRNSDAVNVNEQEIKSQSFLLGKVYLATSTIYTGVLYPIGTPAFRVNNLKDAILIAEREGLRIIDTIGFVIASGGTTDIAGFKLVGGSGSTNVVLLSGTSTVESDFEKLIVAGTFNGLPRVVDCILGATGLGGVTGVEGRIKDSIINHVDGIIQKSGGVGTLLDNCSFVTPDDQQVTFNANGEGFGFRDVTGNVIITNATKVEDLQVHIKGAIVEIDPSCTAGQLTFTGSGTLIDNSNGTIVINNLNTGGGGSSPWTIIEKDEVLAYSKKASDNAEQANNKIN